MLFSYLRHGETERLTIMYWDGQFATVARSCRRKTDFVAYAPTSERPTLKLSHGKPVLYIGSQKLSMFTLTKCAPNQTFIMDNQASCHRDTYTDHRTMVVIAANSQPFGVQQMQHDIIVLDHCVEMVYKPCVHNLFGVLVLFNEDDVPYYVELADLGLNGELFATSGHSMFWLEDESGQRLRAYVHNGRLHLENGNSVELRLLSQWKSPQFQFGDSSVLLNCHGVIRSTCRAFTINHSLSQHSYRVMQAGDYDVLVDHTGIISILHTDGIRRISIQDDQPVFLGQTRRLFEAIEQLRSSTIIKNDRLASGSHCFISVKSRCAYMLPMEWTGLYHLPNHLICMSGIAGKNVDVLSPAFDNITIPPEMSEHRHYIARNMLSAYRIQGGLIVTSTALRYNAQPWVSDLCVDSLHFSEERPFEIWLNGELHHLVYANDDCPRFIGTRHTCRLFKFIPNANSQRATSVFEHDQLVIRDTYYPQVVFPTVTRSMHKECLIRLVRGYEAGTFIAVPEPQGVPHMGFVVTNTGRRTKPASREEDL